MKLTLTVIVGLLALKTTAQGPVDGFFKEKGQIDVALTASYAGSKTYFAGTSPIQYERNQTILSGFATYGLIDRLNIIGTLPIINYKPQDLGIYAKYQLIKSPLTVAPAIGVSFPIWNYTTESGQSIGQRAVVIQPKIIAQYKFKDHWIIQSQGGYNYALSPVPSSYVFSGKIGFFKNSWYTDFWYENQTGIGGKNYGGGEVVNSFRELGVSYQRIGGVVYKHGKKKMGYFINGFYTFDGRNTSKFTSVGVGIVWKLGS